MQKELVVLPRKALLLGSQCIEYRAGANATVVSETCSGNLTIIDDPNSLLASEVSRSKWDGRFRWGESWQWQLSSSEAVRVDSPCELRTQVSGWQSQQTGDTAQAIVANELSRGGFLVGEFSPDAGEDLWAEVDGRQAIATGDFPLRGLFQVKGTASADEEFIVQIELDSLKRWASQPLPVFVVGVSTSTGRLFIKSVDAIIASEFLGKNVFHDQRKTVRVRLEPASDIASVAREAIEHHYGPLQLNLADVADDEIAAHYFEVLQRQQPEAFDLVPSVGWLVLWKSSPRPQHFAAMIAELARRAREANINTRPTPALFIFHVYRSLEDRHYNLAVARVDVINPDHPKSLKIREVLELEDGYRVRQDRDVKPLREFMQSKTSSAEEFRRYALRIGPQFDTLSEKVVTRGASGGVVWDEPLQREFSTIDDLWNNGPFAPPECRALEAVLSDYYGCLLSHNHVALRRARDLQPEVVHRLLRQDEARLVSFRGAWSVVLRTER